MVAPEVAPNVSARGADDVDMGDEVAQRGASDAESIGSDEVREPRRRNSPSHPTSKAAKSLRMVRRSQSHRGIIESLEPGIESTKLRWNSVETVQFW